MEHLFILESLKNVKDIFLDGLLDRRGERILMKKVILTLSVSMMFLFLLSNYSFASTPVVLNGVWTFTFYQYSNGATSSVLSKNFNLSQLQNNSFFSNTFIGKVEGNHVQFLYVNITNENYPYWWSSNQPWNFNVFYGNVSLISGNAISLVGKIADQNLMQGSWVGTFNGQAEMGTWQAVRLTSEQVANQNLWNLEGLTLILLALVLLRLMI